MTYKLSPLSYLIIIIISLVSSIAFFYYWATSRSDHFGAISLNGDASYYQNYGDWLALEVQDRDIFYHNIGHSIENARKADIILLGHSMVMWAFREDQIKAFERKHGVKIYNLSFPGVASGEFVRRVAKRWGIHPKLWVINADDQAANFFNPVMDDFGPFGKSTTLEVAKYGRFKSFLRVSGRNLRWRIGDSLFTMLPPKLGKSFFPSANNKLWRSAESGNWYIEQMATYTKPDNPLIKLLRAQDCHANFDETKNAKDYLTEMGGSSILMLIPSQNFCPQRVRELAKAIKKETVIPPSVAYTTADGGQHLDKKGAQAFTEFFLSALEKTEAFKKLTSNH